MCTIKYKMKQACILNQKHI